MQSLAIVSGTGSWQTNISPANRIRLRKHLVLCYAFVAIIKHIPFSFIKVLCIVECQDCVTLLGIVVRYSQ